MSFQRAINYLEELFHNSRIGSLIGPAEWRSFFSAPISCLPIFSFLFFFLFFVCFYFSSFAFWVNPFPSARLLTNPRWQQRLSTLSIIWIDRLALSFPFVLFSRASRRDCSSLSMTSTSWPRTLGSWLFLVFPFFFFFVILFLSLAFSSLLDYSIQEILPKINTRSPD